MNTCPQTPGAPSAPAAPGGQNFAVARARPCARVRALVVPVEARPAAPPRTAPAAPDALGAAQVRWLRLLGEPGAWEDPVKRRALLRARLEYQDALLEAAYEGADAL